MILTLSRTYFSKGTNSDLEIDGKYHCHTIELPWKNNQRGISCIPEGTYPIRKRYSQKFGSHLHIIPVPGRTYILMHPANNALEELNGCIAPVTTLTGDGIGLTSRDRLKEIVAKVYAAIDKGEQVFITIKKKEQKMAKILTGAILQKIAPSLKADRANFLADLHEKILTPYGMYNKDVLPEFIAQICHESIEYSAKTENMNYSATAIKNTWPSRFKSIAEATPYARNPQKLANKVYGSRMGNREGTDDGWNFRGSGFMQLTGKESVLPYFAFKKAGRGYPFPQIPNTPEAVVELMRTDDAWALDSACWLFAISKGLIDEAEDNLFVTITKKINGGTIGMASRNAYYKKALQFI